MTYLAFPLVFTIPAVLLLWVTLPRSLGSFGGLRGRAAIPLLCLIAFVYTTPWDNYLVARQVWWYGLDRVIATIGYVPIEEYFFFLIQPVLTGLFLFHVLGRWDTGDRPSSVSAHTWGSLFWATISGVSFLLLWLDVESALYLSLILSWSGPVLTAMWLYDGQTLWRKRWALFVGVGVPTVYLWLADAIAIYQNIWTISSTYTLGLQVWTLPLEEATFFLVTNLLVVKGILLLLYGDHETAEHVSGRMKQMKAA